MQSSHLLAHCSIYLGGGGTSTSSHQRWGSRDTLHLFQEAKVHRDEVAVRGILPRCFMTNAFIKLPTPQDGISGPKKPMNPNELHKIFRRVPPTQGAAGSSQVPVLSAQRLLSFQGAGPMGAMCTVIVVLLC